MFEHLLSIEYHQASIFLPFPKSRPTTKLSLFASRLRLSKAFFSLETSFDPKNWQRTLKSKRIENKVSFPWDVEKPFLYIEYRILSKRSILQDHPDKNVVSNFCRSLCPQKWTFSISKRTNNPRRWPTNSKDSILSWWYQFCKHPIRFASLQLGSHQNVFADVEVNLCVSWLLLSLRSIKILVASYNMEWNFFRMVSNRKKTFWLTRSCVLWLLVVL